MNGVEQELRLCKKCGELKPLSEFNKRNDGHGGGYHCYCRVCDREYSREHYRKNKKYYREKQSRFRDQGLARVWQYKCKHPCGKCGEDHPACLVFHHRNPGDKDKCVSKMAANGTGWPRLLAEIQKCVVLCTNCHRKLHYDERIAVGRTR